MKENVSVTLSKEVVEYVKKLAEAEERSFSNMLDKIIKDVMQQNKSAFLMDEDV